MLCGSHIKIWNPANHTEKQNKKHQNAKSIGEKLKTKGLMFFVSFFSCDLQDFKGVSSEPSGKMIKVALSQKILEDFYFSKKIIPYLIPEQKN